MVFFFLGITKMRKWFWDGEIVYEWIIGVRTNETISKRDMAEVILFDQTSA